MSVPPTQDLAGLLAEDRWMRRLARRLAADGHAAEDLAQDAWVAALTGGGGAQRPRAWLGGVVRNLWRDLARLRAQRVQREQRAARDEQLPSADELVEELELRKHVASALCELEEPYRRTLTLRFFHDRSLRAIAEAEGLSIAAVHEREQRGLARLRARLARTSRGNSESWAVALFALARPRGWIATGLETIAMASAWKLGTAAVVLVAGGVAWWLRDAERAPHASVPVAAQELELPAPAPIRRSELDSALPARESVPAQEAPSSAAAATPPAPVRLAGRVLDPSGAPVAGAALAWSLEPELTTRSAADGHFEFELAADAPAPELLDFGVESKIHCTDAGRVTLLAGLRNADGEALVLVAPRSTSAGVVVGGDGLPLAGATVAVRVRDAVYRELGVPRPTNTPLDGDGRALGALLTVADERGEFRLEGVPSGAGLYLLVEAAGHASGDFELPVVPDLARVLALEASRKVTEYHGLVREPRGAPVPGARVSLGQALVTCDADGHFRIAPGSEFVDPEADGPRAGEAPLELVALHPGHQPARLSLAGHDPAQPLELVLGPAPLAIRGRVLDAEGRVRAGVQVWPLDPTVLGNELSQVSEGMTAAFTVTIEDVLRGGFGRRGTRTDEEGRFELDGLIARTYRLGLFDPASAERGGPFEVEAGRSGVELVLPGSHCVRVAGRVVSLGGAPIADVGLRAQGEILGDAYARPPGDAGSPIRTDSEGRFAFERLAIEGTVLVLQHPRLMFRAVTLEGRADLADLELVEPLLCELQVDLSVTPDLADRLQVLDAAGQPLTIIESFGVGFMAGDDARFTRGLSEVLSVPESARTLVLFAQGLEVLRRPLTLDPTRRTDFRP